MAAAAAEERREAAARNADVRVYPSPTDGRSTLTADLPTDEAVECHDLLDQLARMLKADGDQRPIGALRAHVLSTLIRRPADSGLPHVAANVTVTAEVVPDDDDTTDLDVRGPAPFVEAAAAAMGIDRLRVIDTGLDPVTAEREQWDDGNNTLALAPRLAVAYERNTVTNAALEAAGIEVVRIAGSELGSGRGGPRCMSCPVARDPLTVG